MGGGRCRFYPDCSTYSLEAVKEHGAMVGSWLTYKRLIKCGPLHPGGYDPVPTKEELAKKRKRKFLNLTKKGN